MQTVSSEFTAMCTAALRTPTQEVLVEWNAGSGVYVDETDQVQEWSCGMRLDVTGAEILPAQGSGSFRVTLRNVGWRYSAYASGGDTAIRSYLTGAAGLVGLRVKIRAGFVISGAEQKVDIFRGVITGWEETSDQKAIVLSGEDRSYELNQRRASSQMSEDIFVDDWIYDLAVTHGGMDGGDVVRDQALFKLPFAWLDDDSVWEEMTAAAAAEGGRVYCDYAGKLRYENALHWLSSPHRSSQWTFSASNIGNLTAQPETGGLATETVLEWSERRVDQVGAVYTLDRVKTVGPGETLTWLARFDSVCRTVYPLIEGRDYVVVSAGGMNLKDKVTVNLTALETFAGQAEVSVTNSHTNLAAIVRWLQIRGEPVTGGPDQEDRRSTGLSLNYARVRSARANPLVQTQGQVNFLAPQLARRSSQITRLWQLSDVPGVPQMELGDYVTFGDGRVVNSSRTGYVVGWELRYSANGGMVEDFIVLDASGYFPTPSSLDWFVVGTTALGSGRAYY